MTIIDELTRNLPLAAIVLLAPVAAGCRSAPPPDVITVSGYVEAAEVQVAPEVGGRILELAADEGDRIAAGDLVARLDTRDVELALKRLQAERQQAQAQLRLLLAGARVEDVRQAEAQLKGAEADVSAAEIEAASASTDLERFESLLKSNSGSQKQRDDTATRHRVAVARLNAARERVAAAGESLARLRAGARREEIDAARARVAIVDAQTASLEKTLGDAVVTSPLAGVVIARLVERGEIVAPRTPLVVVADLDHAWANLYVDEPLVPRLALGQKAALMTDAGQRLEGTVTFISAKAEFTPRNVQTAEERAKLVYRIKVSVDNRAGVLKQGMPVEAELGLTKQ